MSDDYDIKKKELELKELELKERELALRERELLRKERQTQFVSNIVCRVSKKSGVIKKWLAFSIRLATAIVIGILGIGIANEVFRVRNPTVWIFTLFCGMYIGWCIADKALEAFIEYRNKGREQ